MIRHLQLIVVICAVIAVHTTRCPAQNPFLEVVERLVGNSSVFNGPDRIGGADTLHGEIEDHWFTDYAEPPWLDVSVPTYQNNGEFEPITPVSPQLPQWDTSDDDQGVFGTFDNGGTLKFPPELPIHVVTGRFVTGAVKWPHEEYVEQFAQGLLDPLTDAHMVPVYWICQYYLFIPDEYADTPPNDTLAKALIVYGKSGTQPSNLPKWLMPAQLGAYGWLNNAGIYSCRRLRVPVMVITVMPERTNTWNTVENLPPQGGITGYDSEGHAFFPTEWAAKQDPEPDLIVMHPQFMYAASYIRAVTFLDGFFNPTALMGTADWPQWDEITNNDTQRYTPMTDVTLDVTTDQVDVARLVCLVDPKLTGMTVRERELIANAPEDNPGVLRDELALDPNQLQPSATRFNWAEELLRAVPGQAERKAK